MESTLDQPRSGSLQAFLFRTMCAYWVVYIFPFPLGYFPYVNWLTMQYGRMWRQIVPWVAQKLFGITITFFPAGSGDTTFNYVQLVCYLVVAVFAAIVWTFLSRKQGVQGWVREWLRIYVRYFLAATMITYGAVKVIKSQFPDPGLDRLLQPYGDSSPMGLLWTFMGYSAAYNVFAGLGEMIGGLLFTVRRTTLLGSLVTMLVMAHVMALNYCFDVPVKLFSTHLFLMAVYLAAPDFERLSRLLILNRPVSAADDSPLFRRTWMNRGSLAIRTLLVIALTLQMLYMADSGRKTYGDLAKRSALYGVWHVDEFSVDGVALAPLIDDKVRWRRVVFDQPTVFAIQMMSGSRTRFGLRMDEENKTLNLTRREDPKWSAKMTFQKTGDDALKLEGTMDGKKIRAKLTREDLSQFLLISRGFHWINETPFNR